MTTTRPNNGASRRKQVLFDVEIDTLDPQVHGAVEVGRRGDAHLRDVAADVHHVRDDALRDEAGEDFAVVEGAGDPLAKKRGLHCRA